MPLPGEGSLAGEVQSSQMASDQNNNRTNYSDVVDTDLALESRELIVSREGPPELPGVEVDTEEYDIARVTRIKITTDEGSRLMGKVRGNYSTVESEVLTNREKSSYGKLIELLAREIGSFIEDIPMDATVLVAGLGNWNATPDALGPRVVGRMLVTRHLLGDDGPDLGVQLRPVAAIAPGVLGLTGVETGEIIQGIVERIQPAQVIVVDALAARGTRRLCSTIQIADSGINPGAGVGNRRAGITAATLGVPVLAIGVPTVVRAATIVSDGIDHLLGRAPGGNEEDIPGRTHLKVDTAQLREGADQLFEAPDELKQKTITEVLAPFLGDLIVTPKEIDVLIQDVARIVSGALNTCLQPEFSFEEIEQYVS